MMKYAAYAVSLYLCVIPRLAIAEEPASTNTPPATTTAESENKALLDAKAISDKIVEILDAEAAKDGTAPTSYPSSKLLPALSANGSASREERSKSANQYIGKDVAAFLIGLKASKAQACSSILEFMKSELPAGATKSNDIRDEDLEYFKTNGAIRTFWTDDSGKHAISEVRQLFFMEKDPAGEATTASIFGAVSAMARTPDSTDKFHYYEYKNPLEPAKDGYITRVSGAELPEPAEFNINYMVKKCVTIFTKDKYCNTMLERAYKIADNAYILTSQLYNVAMGDIKMDRDGYGSTLFLSSLNMNSADGYTNLYLVVDLGNKFAVYFTGLMSKKDYTPQSFLRSQMRDSIVSELGAERETIEGKAIVTTQTCSDVQ